MERPHCEHSMACTHTYFFSPPAPDKLFLYTPTYLLPKSFDLCPASSIRLDRGLGRLVLFPFPPYAHPPPLFVPSYLPPI